jgi:DNA repair protein RecN (Recombination protein N)
MEVPPAMLRSLRISNLAVIESIETEFEPGFTVITGETGAGKSVLVDALGLLLGDRAASDMVRTGATLATIDATFEDAAGRPSSVRREITSQGRSRAFIDGAPATTAALRALAGGLVELHGQHEHQTLMDPASHLALVDQYGSLHGARAEVAAAWSEWRTLTEQLERSRMDARERAARLDLIGFQLGEIERVAPHAGEDEELASTRTILASAEHIRSLSDESYAALYDGDRAVLATLAGVWKRVAELASFDARFAPHLDARDAIKAELEDLAALLRDRAHGLDASPGRLQEVEDRVVAIEHLKRRYGPTLQDVLDRAARLQGERQLLVESSERAGDLEPRVDRATAAYLDAARRLSRARRTAASRFAAEVEGLLGELAMPRTRFEVRFAEEAARPAWSDAGIDVAEFYISPNVGEDLRPLVRTVSGGELSRVMLALKTLSLADEAGKTLVFDEVDAGIGGHVAEVVGDRLRQLGRRYQVLCVTHLPQIAARGTGQVHIAKSVRRGRTITSVRRLDEAGRIEEIARMMAGESVTDAVRRGARHLLAR